MARRREFSIFSMSFLDCICCGFGAVILLFVIINARAATVRREVVVDLRGEVSRLEFEVLKGERGLVLARNTLDETTEELVRTEGRSRELLEEVTRIEVELADRTDTTVAAKEHVNQLKADLKSLEEEVKRLEAAVEADREGQKLREFKGTGDRHYVTGLKVGGQRILILVDCSASMLDKDIIDVLRVRNMSDDVKRSADKWVQAKRTVDWLSTQIPATSRFQVYGFNETAFALLPGSGGTWLEAKNPEELNGAIDALQNQVPDKGTSLFHAFRAIRSLEPPPDNVILVTDGLPTFGEKRPFGYKVSPKKRYGYFVDAVRQIPAGIPVNTILLPMEGDPRAASAFWRLAIDTRGSYFCPAGDWP